MVPRVNCPNPTCQKSLKVPPGKGQGQLKCPGCGTVFKLSPTSKGWAETVLYRFTGGTDGAFPRNLVLDSAGNLFGTTLGGGSFSGNNCSLFGCGVVFELSPGPSDWTETVLHTFTGGSDGWRPAALTPGMPLAKSRFARQAVAGGQEFPPERAATRRRGSMESIKLECLP